MKIKLIVSLCLSLVLPLCYAERVSDELKEVVKNLPITNGIEILLFQGSKYIVSIADADITGNTPSDKLNAMKIAKQISEAEISKFVNGEDIYIKEILSSIRITKTSDNGSEIILDDEVYEEFIQNRSSGAIRGMRSIRWKFGNVYHVASLLQFTQN